jgi:hypothetical protein
MKIWNALFLFLLLLNIFGCSVEAQNNSAKSLENSIKSIGCKIRKPDGSVLFFTDFIQWKKDEFKMISQTAITASYGMAIYFEEEVYANGQDAESRLQNLMKVSPEIATEQKKMHDKVHTELEFREAFRRGKKVYIVSVPAYGSWLNGNVAKYRKQLEKVIK